MLKLLMIHLLLASSWPSGYARGVYRLTPITLSHQQLSIPQGLSEDAPIPYSFEYAVEGKDGSNSHKESGDGSGNVVGSYSLKVKDGRSRKVDYRADAGGFKAKVDTNEPGTKSENPAEVSFHSSAPQLTPIGSPAISFGSQSYQSGLAVGGAPSPYSFSYNAEGLDGGSSHQESGTGSGNVIGSYSLKVKDGRSRQVDYTADAGGFKAKVNTNEQGTKSSNPADAVFYSSALAPVDSFPVSYVGATAGHSSVQVSQSIHGDGSIGAPSPYSFAYVAAGKDGSSSHQESADGSGNVKGSYSLNINDGRSRKVDYTADAGGFKAKVDTNEPGTKSDSPAQVSFHSSAPQLIPELAAIGIPGSPANGVPASGSAAFLYQAGLGIEGAPSPYSFGYTAEGAEGSSSHQESSDGSGNVRGSYSLNIKDGRRRKVDYTADAGGFKAKVDTNEPGTKSESPAEVSFQSFAPQIIPVSPGIAVPGPATFAIPAPSGGAAFSYQAGLGIEGAPSPYSFGYTAQGTEGSSSHQESADGSGNVRGSYSLNIKDGRRRKVDYTADAGGFKAKVDTNEPGTKSESPAEVSFQSSAPQIIPASLGIAVPAPSGGTAFLYQAGLGIEGAPSPYSFGYTADGAEGSSSHQESSDGSGNVKGSYSLSINDGRRRKVDYTADASGFKASVDTNEPGTKSDSPAQVSFRSSAPAGVAFAVPSQTFPQVGSGSVSFQVLPGAAEGAPSPYSFDYTAAGADGSSSHQESSDGSGNVKGSYSLNIKDGRSRKVDYTADAAGFKASVNTNEPGTKSDNPAHVIFHSAAPQLTPIAVGASAPILGSGAVFYQGSVGGEGAPSPYSFSYTAEGKEGGSSHQESSDGSGSVKGSYSLRIKDGRSRKVDYTADGSGFKAKVDTNEPGTKNDNPAEVSFHSSAEFTGSDFHFQPSHQYLLSGIPHTVKTGVKSW